MELVKLVDFNIKVPEELRQKFKIAAISSGVTVQEFGTEALREKLSQVKPKEKEDVCASSI